MRRWLLTALPFVVASAPCDAAAKVRLITIDRMRFGAVPADLQVGDTIRWKNRDLFRHSATAADGSFDIDMQPGKSGSIVLKRAGNIAFACKYHPGMGGTLLVRH